MKTTLELPDQVYRKAKATAAARGQSLKDFVTEALRDKFAAEAARPVAAEPLWMRGFGKLRHLHKETVRVQGVIDDECEVIEPDHRS